MHPEDRPALDEAEREARLVAELRGASVGGAPYLTLGNVLVIVLGFALAWGAALLVMQP